MGIRRADLAKLTLGKATVNTAVRWLPFFLPTLAVAFDASTATLAGLLGIAEAAGLSTIYAGRWLDAGRERVVIICALLGVVVSSALALVGSIWWFGAAAIVLGVSAGHVTAGGHAWISARVTFARRARFIGIYEVSWASALLIGAPLIAILISAFGWRGPFVAVGLAATVAAVGVATVDDGPGAIRPRRSKDENVPLSPDAWIVVGAAATTGLAGLTTIAVAGTWLDESLEVSTGGVGLVAMAFGAAELLASLTSSAFADRLGKRTSMQYSMTALIVGLAVVAVTGTSLMVGAIGLFVFFVGSEYSIVTSFSLVSEAMPEARGRVLGISNAAGTLARGAGIGAAGVLYAAFGIKGPAALSAAAALATLTLLGVIGRRRPDLT